MQQVQQDLKLEAHMLEETSRKHNWPAAATAVGATT
jgi:hypothetical protein